MGSARDKIFVHPKEIKMPAFTRLSEVISQNGSSLLDLWTSEQLQAISKQGVIQPEELRTQCSEFLTTLNDALQSGNSTSFQESAFDSLKEVVASISKSRALQGFSPSETALFIFSLKKPLFSLLQNSLRSTPETLTE